MNVGFEMKSNEILLTFAYITINWTFQLAKLQQSFPDLWEQYQLFQKELEIENDKVEVSNPYDDNN